MLKRRNGTASPHAWERTQKSRAGTAKNFVLKAFSVRKSILIGLACFVLYNMKSLRIQVTFARKDPAILDAGTPIHEEVGRRDKSSPSEAMENGGSQRRTSPPEEMEIGSSQGRTSPFPKFLEDYVQFHSSMKEHPNAKYLIWRCPLSDTTSRCGGTGDRIKGILSALYTAMCTNRVLLIHWPVDGSVDVSIFLKPQKINWEISPKLRPVWHKSIMLYQAIDDYHNKWFVDLAVPSEYESSQFIDFRCNIWSDWEKGAVRTNDTACIQNLWEREPPQLNPHYDQDDYLFRYGFWTLFTFSSSVHQRKRMLQEQAELVPSMHAKQTDFVISNHRKLQQKASMIQINGSITEAEVAKDDDTMPTLQTRSRRRLQDQESGGSAIGGETGILPYIAVHIRTGIGTSWNDPLRHSSHEDYQKFYQCAKKLQKGIVERQRQASAQCPNSNTAEPHLMRIYVAADNPAAKQALKQMDNAAPEQTIRTIDDLEMYHIDRSKITGNKLDPELTVWAELNVLLESTCIITSRSGFSDLAKWLQPAQHRRCAIQYNMCENESQVEQALNNVAFPCDER